MWPNNKDQAQRDSAGRLRRLFLHGFSDLRAGDTLTAADLRVLHYLLELKRYREIGLELGLKERSVKSALRRIAYKIAPEYDPRLHLLRVIVGIAAGRAVALSPIVEEALQ